MEKNSSKPLKLFYCYTLRDRSLRNRLDTHLAILRHSGLISTWYDGEIHPGIVWEQEIKTHFDKADIILLLISSDFLASDYCYSKEMTYAIERHHAKEARVVPVLLRPTDWNDAPFSTLQMLPSRAVPVTAWRDRDKAFEDVAKGIRRVVNDLLSPDITTRDSSASVVFTKPFPQTMRISKVRAIELLKAKEESIVAEKDEIFDNLYHPEVAIAAVKRFEREVRYLLTDIFSHDEAKDILKDQPKEYPDEIALNEILLFKDELPGIVSKKELHATYEDAYRRTLREDIYPILAITYLRQILRNAVRRIENWND